ncbi:hypothetical protein Pla52o_06340 [Novipirellula galeiformis]|uniref:Uncharacterized protein n=1 Tax=Novipirellula galeiformis TaxID=2528004 RepID=A0A5C6CVN6_9BACT|nr:hypothetical protein [Novipirellula galeiformis]TWU26779.1 hypothetical protein Pla52o_06340 [Novipirellula galeiformis]
MSLELLYTSTTSGLRQGSRGFCTVLSTAGMPVNLASRLETLSGYRHVFPPQDANAETNPICYSHLRVKVGGISSSVLSRISAYGVDYSGRSNKLAHHVVAEAFEQAPAGPAWVLSQKAILREQWDGNNETPPTGPAIPMQNQVPAICQAWKAVMGDAGWGGHVADTFRASAARPLWIIFDLSQNAELLSLLNESIALLPEAERWLTTFSTYYTNLPPEIECRVRCVLAGTEEARLASARGGVIDLTQPQTLTATSPLIELARNGFKTGEAADPVGATNAAPSITQAHDSPAAGVGAGSPPQMSDPSYALQPPTPRPATGSRRPPPRVPSEPPFRSNPRSSRTAVLLGIAGLMLLIVAGAVPIILNWKIDGHKSVSSKDIEGSDNEQVDEIGERRRIQETAEIPFLKLENEIKDLKYVTKTTKPELDLSSPVAPAALVEIEDAIGKLRFDPQQSVDFSVDQTEIVGQLKSEVGETIGDQVRQETLKQFRGVRDTEPPSGLVASIASIDQNLKSISEYYATRRKEESSFNERVATMIDHLNVFMNANEEYFVLVPEASTRLKKLQQIANQAFLPIDEAALAREETALKQQWEEKLEAFSMLQERIDKALIVSKQIVEIQKELDKHIATQKIAQEQVEKEKLLLVRINFDSQNPTNISGAKTLPISLKRSEMESFRWEQDAKDKTASLSFKKLKKGEIAEVDYPNQNFLKLKIQSESPKESSEIIIEYRPRITAKGGPRYNESSTESFDANCNELIKTLDEANALKKAINNWTEETFLDSKIQAEKDTERKQALESQNAEIEQINKIRGEVQSLIKKDWKHLTNAPLKELQKHHDGIKAIQESQKHSGYLTPLPLRLENLNGFIIKQERINVLISELSKPTPVPEEKLFLLKQSKGANLFQTSKDSFEVDFSLSLQLTLTEEAK